jgi:hypothetical protein
MMVAPPGDSAVRIDVVALSDGSRGEVPIWLDVFVAPDIDHASADEGTLHAPATLYLGSVTGTVPIDLEISSNDQDSVACHRLHKGWTEIALPACGDQRVFTLKFTPRVSLRRGFGIRISRGYFERRNIRSFEAAFSQVQLLADNPPAVLAFAVLNAAK